MTFTYTKERMPTIGRHVILKLANGEYCRGYRQIPYYDEPMESFVNCGWIHGMAKDSYLPADDVIGWAELWPVPDPHAGYPEHTRAKR